jgi:hypothetical protein
MKWIVIGEESGKIKLVSDRSTDGLLPKGSFLTVETGKAAFVLRIEGSLQLEPYAPSPLIADMDLGPLRQDQECRNVLFAHRVLDLNPRADGFIDFIPPQVNARRSTQGEIDKAIGGTGDGPRIFIATLYANHNEVLKDESGRPIGTALPRELYFHQTLICGRTGSGKTVAAKYLAQHFVEKMGGAALAINVKDIDFLRMNRSSTSVDPQTNEEWEALGELPRGIDNFIVYNPPSVVIPSTQDVDREVCQQITLDVNEIDAEALSGLLVGVTDVAAQNLPGIFRYWQEKESPSELSGSKTFSQFANYFNKGKEDKCLFRVLNVRGEESEIILHRGTFENIRRNLSVATDFFDNPSAKTIDETDILVRGKLSVLNVAGRGGIQFGSIFLRDILHRIYDSKSSGASKVPILIVIDEVHQFYGSESSLQALGDLDAICRTGRSLEIGVVFSSQTQGDIPRGLANVINTRVFFKTDAGSARQLGTDVTAEEMEGLKTGFAVVSVHGMPGIKIVKFPLSFAGVS